MVSIPHWFDSTSPSRISPTAQSRCFNPTLVRFNVASAALAIARQVLVSIPHWFDSTAGANAAEHRCVAGFNPTLVRFNAYKCIGDKPIQPRFNPTLVRFNVHCKHFQVLRGCVSIPHWFDSTTTWAECRDSPAAVSIPHWFDSTTQPIRASTGTMAGFNPTLVRFNAAVVEQGDM